MARRNINDFDGTNLDSLMDTLTNVVAILVFILIMVQINASRSVKKMMSELPPVSAAQLVEKQREFDAAAAQLAENRAARLDPAKAEQLLRTTSDEVLALRSRKAAVESALVSRQAVLKQWQEKEAELNVRKNEMSALMARKELLTANLRGLSAQTAPEPKEVRIPNSRPLPTRAGRLFCFVSGDRLYTLDEDEPAKLAMQEIRASTDTLKPGKVRRGNRNVPVYDQNALKGLFDSKQLKTAHFAMELPLNPPWTRMSLVLKPLAGGGMSTEGIDKLQSPFQTLLRSLRSGPGRVLWFIVMPDSFDTYLAARRAADAAGVPAGWEIATAPHLSFALNDIEVKNLVPPPEPGPPDPDAIPPPRPSLD